MVDALIPKGDEGRGVAAISLGEVMSNLWSGDFRIRKRGAVNLHHSDVSQRPNPLKWNISVSGGKEKNFYSPSSGERKGNSLNFDLLFLIGSRRVVRWKRSGATQRESTKCDLSSQMSLERAAKEGNSPVGERHCMLLVSVLEYLEERWLRGKQAELSAKAKYFW